MHRPLPRMTMRDADLLDAIILRSDRGTAITVATDTHLGHWRRPHVGNVRLSWTQAGLLHSRILRTVTADTKERAVRASEAFASQVREHVRFIIVSQRDVAKEG